MTKEQKVVQFDEKDDGFYDLEYFLSLEYRYFSKFSSSRLGHIFKHLNGLGLKGKSVLDVGCGGGFFTDRMSKMGARVIGCDYSRYAVEFAKERYPGLKVIQHSAYEIDQLDIESPDLITAFDVIEHLGKPEVFLEKVFKILKPGGRIVITTDNDDYFFSKFPFNHMRNILMRTSASGRAYRLIKKVEIHRRQFKDYHPGHISPVSSKELLKRITQTGFKVEKKDIYPLVSIPLLDFFAMFLPSSIKGDHQLVIARKS